MDLLRATITSVIRTACGTKLKEAKRDPGVGIDDVAGIYRRHLFLHAAGPDVSTRTAECGLIKH